MTRALLLSVCLGLLAVGCVPYQTYKKTRDELERAKLAVDDLTKKYNHAITELAGYRRGEAVALATDPDAAAQIAMLTQKNNELEAKLANLAFTQETVPDANGVRRGPYGGIELGNAALFAEGSASLTPSAHRVLDNIVSTLRNPPYERDKVFIEGHTDNQELKVTRERWGTNMNLGFQRAYAVYNYFLSKGIGEERMEIGAFAYLRPVDRTNMDTEAGRQRNRRVVVRRIGTEY